VTFLIILLKNYAISYQAQYRFYYVAKRTSSRLTYCIDETTQVYL